MAMPAIRRRWTAADVRQLTREDRAWPRYELLDGELLVTPAPGWGHQLAVLELATRLKAFVDRTRIGIAMTSPADIELVPQTIMQPDVFVVPRSATPNDTEGKWSDINALLLAAEVLSPSTARVDRIRKRDFYLGAGVPEYWIVDLDASVIERWTSTSETPLIERARFEWRPSTDHVLSIDVADFFRTVRETLREMGRK
jgi:Uma2 family endonuclease